MCKRKYTDIKKLEPQIIEMRKQGKTRQEIADYFGLEKQQIKNWVSRYNRQQEQLEKGIIPKTKGHPRKNGESIEQELERLRMENKLLRDFLRLSERM